MDRRSWSRLTGLIGVLIGLLAVIDSGFPEHPRIATSGSLMGESTLRKVKVQAWGGMTAVGRGGRDLGGIASVCQCSEKPFDIKGRL